MPWSPPQARGGLQVRRVTGAWDANNLYWANKPAATTEDAQINKAGYDLACSDGAQRLEWNVTGIAQDWAAGAADHGLVVQSPSEGSTTMAFHGPHTTVAGGFYMDGGFSANETIRLADSRVERELSLNCARLDNPGGDALQADEL
ncbi:DNRLRE domain-containing protein [Nonomuraea sp. NPDC050680]|uniref:DNRLRE domain-containing protein n=1 Tax=Nonomuraea sp. NPDC050680 TaxID=3154630 RepID=UPI0033F8B047